MGNFYLPSITDIWTLKPVSQLLFPTPTHSTCYIFSHTRKGNCRLGGSKEALLIYRFTPDLDVCFGVPYLSCQLSKYYDVRNLAPAVSGVKGQLQIIGMHCVVLVAGLVETWTIPLKSMHTPKPSLSSPTSLISTSGPNTLKLITITWD